jgi:hypothetical protein
MSSRPEAEGKREVEVERAAADAREAAREITHSRTERARVVGEGERHLRDDDAHVEQQAVHQGARFLVGVVGNTADAELVECIDSGAEPTEETKDPAARYDSMPRTEEDTATEKARVGDLRA